MPKTILGNPSERGEDDGRVAVGLRYTEFPHAPGDPPTPHAAAVYPLFDKAVAEPLFEWTLRQLQAAGFDAPQDSARRLPWLPRSPSGQKGGRPRHPRQPRA
eukprot:scaffold30296_cov54-Phaeocystis_antarctica.AAC.2